jgi:hypothetical protein
MQVFIFYGGQEQLILGKLHVVLKYVHIDHVIVNFYVWMYVNIYVWMYVHIYIYTCIHIYRLFLQRRNGRYFVAAAEASFSSSLEKQI